MEVNKKIFINNLTLKEFLNKQINDYFNRDEDGNTILHACAIAKNKEIFDYLIKNKPQLINVKNNNDNTVLHELCSTGYLIGLKKILKLKNITDVNLNVKNTEGNTPLHIAIYNNQKDIVKLLIDNGADLSINNYYNRCPEDEILKFMPLIGNYILDKKCDIIYMIPSKINKKFITNRRMYIDNEQDTIKFVSSPKRRNKIVPERNNSNVTYQSPRKNTKIPYSNNRAYLKKYSYKSKDSKFLNKLINKNGNLDIINHDWTQCIINYYWYKTAKKIFIVQLILYSIYLSLFSSSIILYKENYTNNTFSYYNEYPNYFAIDIILMIINLFYSINEIYEMANTKKIKYYCNNFWNIFDIIQNISVYSIIPMRYFKVESEYTVLSFLSLIFWIKLLNFTRGFKKLGPLVKIIYKMFFDILYFICIYIIILFGFCQAMYLLLSHENEDYSNPIITIITLFKMNIGDFDYTIIQGSEFFIAATVLFIIFNILSVIMLLNILIAMLTDRYNEISTQAEKEWVLSRAKLTLYLLQSLFSTCFKNKKSIDDIQNLYTIIPITKDNNDLSVPYYNIKL